MTELHERIAEVIGVHDRNPWRQHDGWWECYCGEVYSYEHVAAKVAAALYPKPENIVATATYESYQVYVDSGRADELFKAFCDSLGPAIETSWKDTEYV